MKTFPTLYGLDSKGRIKVWSILVHDEIEEAGLPAKIVTRYGLEDGKQQEAHDWVREGKNLGKANETTPYEQAVSEAQSKWNKQLDKGYREDKAELAAVAEAPKAMLAHPYAKRAKAITWPAYVQPKLDGIRLIAIVGEHDVEYVSRNGKPITTTSHFTSTILSLFDAGTVLDGECFNPAMTLQDIVSGAKKQSHLSTLLQYWVYDIVSHRDFVSRLGSWSDRLTQAVGPLVPVPTEMALSEEAMLEMHQQHLLDGYEGSIVRNVNGEYKRGKRSADLQKVKHFEDDEFAICGFRDGRGKFEGAVIWQCETGFGETFEVTPRGTMEQRQEWFRNGEAFLGKQLTVRYANLTPDGIPFHPVGIAVRDYE